MIAFIPLYLIQFIYIFHNNDSLKKLYKKKYEKIEKKNSDILYN